MSKGYVYILSNPSMPGLVKVGKTTRDVNQRADEIYQTGVPTPFKVEYFVLSPDCDELERNVHNSLGEARVSPSREFFEHDLRVTVEVLDNCHREQVEEWLDEFIPGKTISDPDLTVSEADILLMADEVGVPAPTIRDAMEEITAGELSPALGRMQRKYEVRAERMATTGLKVVSQ